MRSVHSVILTTNEVENFPGFLFLKDMGNIEKGDYIVVTEEMTIRTELPATEEKEADVEIKTQHSQKQNWFEIKSVQNEKQMKGVKRGFVMVSVKKVKNPLPKEAEETAEAEA